MPKVIRKKLTVLYCKKTCVQVIFDIAEGSCAICISYYIEVIFFKLSCIFFSEPRSFLVIGDTDKYIFLMQNDTK